MSSLTLKSPSGTILTATSSTGVNGLTIDAATGSYYISSSISGAVGLFKVNPSTGGTSLVSSTTRTDLGSCPVIPNPNPPALSKSFSPGTSSSTSTTPSLTISIGNDNKAPLYLYSALTDTLPSGMTIPSGASVTTTCTNGSVSNTTTSVTLAANTSVPVGGCTISVSKVAVSATGTYTNTITSNSLVTSTGNNSSAASATYTVTSAPQLKLTKTHSGSFTVNQPGSYTLTITNNGQLATSGAITIKDALPAGMQFTSASSSQGTVSAAPAGGTTGTVNFSFTPTTALAVGSSATITVNVLPLEGGTLTNYASVEGGGDPDTGLTPGSACTTEQCASDPTTILVPSGPAVPQGTWSNSACLDFSGVALSVNGAPITKSITTSEGIIVSYTLDVTSNVSYATSTTSATNSENVLQGYVPGSWRGDSWDDYFGSNKTNAVYNNPVGRKVGFTLSAYATYNGQAVPLTVLTGSAEDDGSNEYVKVNTNGTAFAVADRVLGNSRYGDVTVADSGKTVQMSLNSATGNFFLIATTKADATAGSPLLLTSEIAGNGATAQGYCVAFPFDRGDAPKTYGAASHLQSLTFTSALSANTSGTDNLNTTTFASSASTSRTTSYLNGQPDSEKVERGTTATEDSDDALSSPTLGLGVTSYTLIVPYSSNVAATVGGWVDFNGNGTFEASERATASVAAGVGQATLTWTGVNVTTTAATTYARLRISSNGTEASSPTGGSVNGEVEDYAVTIMKTGKITIVKVATPKHSQDFTFTTTGTGLSTFSLDDDSDPTLPNSRTFSGLTAGTYTVTEATLPGWTLTGLTCGAGAVTDLSNRKATVNLTGGADITCTYTNAMQAPNVALRKYVRDATRSTNFSSTSIQALPGDRLQYCITFTNTGGDAPNFRLQDVVPANTTYAGNLIYSASAVELQNTGTSPTNQALPANASLTKVDAAAPSTRKTVVLNTNADGRTAAATGLPTNSSGTICFDVTIN